MSSMVKIQKKVIYLAKIMTASVPRLKHTGIAAANQNTYKND